MNLLGRCVLTVCASVLAGLLVAGCSSATPGSSSNSPGGGAGSSAPGSAVASDSSTPGGPSDSSAPVSTVTVTQSATATVPASTPGCTGSQIAVSAIAPPAGGAAGHEGVVILFRNRSATTCTLTGYPGAAGLNAAGAQIQQATRTLSGMIGGCSCSHPALLTLDPGTTVSAVIEGNIGGPGPCNAIHSLLVTPPNTTVSTHLAVSVPSCGFDVHPVVTGQSGGGPA